MRQSERKPKGIMGGGIGEEVGQTSEKQLTQQTLALWPNVE